MLGQLHIVSEEFMGSDPGSVFAEPSPKLTEAPSFVGTQTAEVSNKDSQGLRVALACQPEIHSLEEFCFLEGHLVDII